MGWIQYQRGKTWEKTMILYFTSCPTEKDGALFGHSVIKLRNFRYSPTKIEEQKMCKTSSVTQHRKVDLKYPGDRRCSFLFKALFFFKCCNFYKNLQIRVKKIQRPLWLCVNCFKKWPHVPLIKCSLKPIRLQRDRKQRCYLRRKHKRNCSINKERYHASVHVAHMCWVGLFFIPKQCILRFDVTEQSILLVVRRLCRWTRLSFSMMPHGGFFFFFYSTGFANGIVESSTRFSQSRLTYFTTQTCALYCIVTQFVEMIVCLWWWDPAQHYPLHLAIVHYCTQCGTVSKPLAGKHVNCTWPLLHVPIS